MSAAPAAASRPLVVLSDVFETLLRLEPLRERFIEVGRPGHELELFFTRALRDGMAFTLAGGAPPFAAVATAALRTLTGDTLSEADIRHILAGFRELPLHDDVLPALRALRAEGVPVYAFTHGSAEIARDSLTRAGAIEFFAGVLSAEEIASFKPPPAVYTWACGQAGSAPAHTALVAAHSWDVHGALRAGLLAGFLSRLEGRLSELADTPHVIAERYDEVITGLLALPMSETS